MAYSEEKVREALRLLGELGSVERAAREAGVTPRTMRRWRDRDRDGMPMRKEPASLDDGQRRAAVAEAIATGRVTATARAYGVSDTALRRWRREMVERGEELPGGVRADEAAAEADAEALRRRVRELELRNAVLEQGLEALKKGPGAGPAALTRRERAAIVGALRGRFPLADLLREVGLARSTYYRHRASLSAAGDRLAWLRPLVADVFAASRGTYGAERVWAEIRRRGLRVSEKLVRRVMREDGLAAASSSRSEPRYSSYEGEGGRAAAPNVLLVDAARDEHAFVAPEPGVAFSTDITEFRLPDDPRKVYLSPMEDLFDGRVASFAAGLSPDRALVRGMLEAAAPSFAHATAIVHSDRGWHYRTPEWVSLCGSLGVVRSMSRRGHSPDNAVGEGLFGRLKVEFFRARDWSGWTAEAFMEELGRYIDWYNSGRLKEFRDAGGHRYFDTIDGRRARLALAA